MISAMKLTLADLMQGPDLAPNMNGSLILVSLRAVATTLLAEIGQAASNTPSNTHR